MEKTYFVDIILPLSIPNLYTYRVPKALCEKLSIGCRAIAPVRNKLYTGIIECIHENPPLKYQAKYIEDIIDETPIVNNHQLTLWKWISNYYMTTLGEVMTAALPGSLKLSSESKVVPYPGHIDPNQLDNLSPKGNLIIEALEVQHVLTIDEISGIIGLKNPHPVIKELIEKRLVILDEAITEKYKPKLENYVKLSDEFDKEENLKILFDQLTKAPKQLEVLMNYVRLSKRYHNERVQVKKTKLQNETGASAGVIKTMENKGIFVVFEKDVGRIDNTQNNTADLKELSKAQEVALLEIKKEFETHRAVLIHGVTSSGKTEVYTKLIENCIENKEQVLFLVPEIALTTQLVTRLKNYFGNKIVVFHSRFSENERHEIWTKILERPEEVQLILGPRSALFLPFKKLGLIIVDEEHENSYKQFDPAPRYHARDTAIVLAQIHDAKVVMGSATPSLETFWNCKRGKFGLVNLNVRFGNVKMPTIEIVDLKDQQNRGKLKNGFSSNLIHAINNAIEKKEQVILFQNRRGYSPLWMCETCGWIPQCKSCDVSLTYHKFINQLKCHYCGYSIAPVQKCYGCGGNQLKMLGLGTEKIEDDLSQLIPHAKIARMDLETTRAKYAFQNLINDFEEGNIDVLVGTQMVTKGLDFNNVRLVGILNADSLIHHPHFKSYERAFQLMGQVAGRAGRRQEQGKVIIQTYTPQHWLLEKLVNHDYIGMYGEEIQERVSFKYPPNTRLINLTLKHRRKDQLDQSASDLGRFLKKSFGDRILGPEYPHIPRIRNYYLQNILIKLERGLSMKESKEQIQKIIAHWSSFKENRSVVIQIDVDPG